MTECRKPQRPACLPSKSSTRRASVRPVRSRSTSWTSIPFGPHRCAGFGHLHWAQPRPTSSSAIALYYIFLDVWHHRQVSPLLFAPCFQDVALFPVCAGGDWWCVDAKGVLWAAHHRHHHKWSDMSEDIHSAKRDSFTGRTSAGSFPTSTTGDRSGDRIRTFQNTPSCAGSIAGTARRPYPVARSCTRSAAFTGLWGGLVKQCVFVARHVLHQLARARLGQSPLSDDRHQPQQLLAGAHHDGRRLAQ